MKRHLIIWDIDGTLIEGNIGGREAMEAALLDILGRPISLESIRFAGNTDPYILSEGLEIHGITPEPELIQRILTLYIATLETQLRQTRLFTPLPGAQDSLQALAPIAYQGIGTGNISPIARLKLESAGFTYPFAFGGYGDDSPDRAVFLQRALDRALEAHQLKEKPEQVVVIGDTLHDIRAARAIGAQVIAVATGGASHAELADAAPDLLLQDLVSGQEALRSFFR